MAEIKTRPTTINVEDFLTTVEPDSKRADAFALLKFFEDVTGENAVMWGPSIVGFGEYHYKYDSGHEGNMCLTGFSPRKASLVVYANTATAKEQGLLEKLGKSKATGVCIYINKLSDIDMKQLEKIVKISIAETKKRYGN